MQKNTTQEMLALIEPENIQRVRTLTVTLALSEVPQLKFHAKLGCF